MRQFSFPTPKVLKQKRSLSLFLVSLSLSQDQKPKLREACLNCLRLLCREYQGMDALTSSEGLTHLFDLIGIGEAHNQNPEEQEVKSEAAKCLVNLTLKHKDQIEAYVQEHNSLPRFIELLKNPSSPKTLLFPLGRVLFHLSIRSDFRDELVKPEIDAGLFFSKVVKQCFEENPESPTPENQLYIREALKVLLNLTTPVGPLGDSGPNGRPPTPQESAWFDILCPTLEKILLLPTTREFHGLKVDAVSCLINVPNTHVPIFNRTLIVPALLNFLDQHIIYTEHEPSGLIPILLILNSISGASAEVREVVRKHIFPPDFGDESPVSVQIPPWIERGDSVAARLVRHMTSSNFGLKHYSQELLFTLCGENPDEFTRLAGFGSAAGLLATRNLLNAFSGVTRGKTTASPRSTASPPTSTTSSSTTSSHSGTTDSESGSANDANAHQQAIKMQRIASMDKEERQRYLESLPDDELRQMAEMMQKLEASGTIKVIRETEKK
eukprot:TRINITY_DN3046_c0_g1_i1.p1 TRINITY_DN3046_c0_g1~~TRINITY_DN3046_c0_g1_i1.p1  ORF type:complete len:547 (-),score=156.08 TRINITY_DN3046_c0_g1_i1:102-1589(-)